MTSSGAVVKDAAAFRTISEAAEALKLPQHVLRFWETRFAQIKPLKRAGGRRFYRPQDVELLGAIRQLLYGDGYTIKGVQRILREQGPKSVIMLARRQDGAAGGSLRTRGDLGLVDRQGRADRAPDVAAALRGALVELATCRQMLLDAASI